MTTGDERRRALRDWAREHHPDVGGDLPSYLAGVERIERRFAAAPAPSSVPPLRVVLAPWPVRLSRRLRRRLRRTRRRRSALL